MQNIDLKNDIGRIAHKTMADVVEIRLREYLKRKSFKPGDPLPKEVELAESLGVSRNVLREALSRLRMLGMVETKKKRGMILSRPDILGSFERVLDPLIIDESTLRDLFELRLTLEVGLADLLYSHRASNNLDPFSRADLPVDTRCTYCRIPANQPAAIDNHSRAGIAAQCRRAIFRRERP